MGEFTLTWSLRDVNKMSTYLRSLAYILVLGYSRDMWTEEEAFINSFVTLQFFDLYLSYCWMLLSTVINWNAKEVTDLNMSKENNIFTQISIVHYTFQ